MPSMTITTNTSSFGAKSNQVEASVARATAAQTTVPIIATAIRPTLTNTVNAKIVQSRQIAIAKLILTSPRGNIVFAAVNGNTMIRMGNSTPPCSPSVWWPCDNRKRRIILETRNCSQLQFNVAVMEVSPRIIPITAFAVGFHRNVSRMNAVPFHLETPLASPGVATLAPEEGHPINAKRYINQ